MKKVIVLFLVLCLVALPVLCACGEEETSDPATSGETSDETSQGGTPFPLEKQDFGGVEITVLSRAGDYSQQFCPLEELENSVINEAVTIRNEYIEENYGLILKVENVSNPAVEIRTMIETNIDTYDIVSDAICRMLPSVVDSTFYSLNDLIQLDNPWWDQNANKYLTLSDKVYFVTGDALFMDDTNTSCVLFNKDFYNQYFLEEYGTLYDMVREGKWTIDVMGKMAKEFSQPDQDGNWTTLGCLYGIVTDGYTGATHLTAGGNIMTASKDENGDITLHVGDERTISAFDKVYNILNDPTITLYKEQLSGDTGWNDIAEMFLNNKALFRVGYVNVLASIMKDDNPDKVTPGIVPIPMISEEQADQGYFNGVNVYQCEVMGIPICNRDRLDATCYMLEALGYYSSTYSPFGKECLNYAFYETTMKLQSVPDQDDADMLDYVLTHRLYDLGSAFDWGGKLIGAFSFNLYGGQNTLVSSWDANKDAIKLAMEATIQAYKDSIA